MLPQVMMLLDAYLKAEREFDMVRRFPLKRQLEQINQQWKETQATHSGPSK